MTLKFRKLGIGLFLGVTTAWGATPPSVPSIEAVSTLKTPPKGESSFSLETALKSISVNVFTNYHGAPVGDMGSSYTPGKAGVTKTSQGTFFDTTLSLGYKLSKDVSIGPDLAFFYTPVLGQGFDMQYTGIAVVDHHLIRTPQLNISGNMVFQVANSDYLKNAGVKYGVKTTPSVFYRFRGTSVALGAFTEAKAYFGETKGKSFKLYAAPTLQYDFSDHFGASLTYEMEAHHHIGQPTLSFDNYQTDLQPGVRWRISKTVLFNPYLMLYTGDKISARNTAVGAILVASIL
ncbi:MAG: hypothetical protein H7301_10545 [Cryobacterium sp.]|nr:hypothetical protein [Oligoflexia bacterium]